MWGAYMCFSFYQKWSNLRILLQTDANEAEMKKFLTMCLVIGHYFDSVFC
jgi:hypothetical protein